MAGVVASMTMMAVVSEQMPEKAVVSAQPQDLTQADAVVPGAPGHVSAMMMPTMMEYAAHPDCSP